MKKYVFIILCIIDFVISSKIFSQTSPPTPTPQYLYYCLNETAVALTANGIDLKWYSALSGGSPLAGAPVPSTANPATGGNPLVYYVTQEVGGIESSPRTPIYVYVNEKLGLYCQTVTTNSIKFDFANVGQSSFNYSYTINNGVPITGVHFSPSNFTVTGLGEGQTVELTLTAVGAKSCVIPEVKSCTTYCSTTQTPIFTQIAPICYGSVAPTLPISSNNSPSITGTWLPAVINSNVVGTSIYTFTPNPVIFPCVPKTTMSITVIPEAIPVFNTIPNSICQNAAAPTLPTASNNAIPISGTWSPSVVDTSILGPRDYVFSPNSGQCTSSTLTTVRVTIVANNSPGFSVIPPVCSGNSAPILATTSPTGVVGVWSPSVIDNSVNGSYLFTPNPNQCSTTQTLNVTITPKETPNFSVIMPICTGDPVPVLAVSSPNGIAGSWFPSVIDNTISGSYLFTPNPTECALEQTLNVTVFPLLDPDFSSITICSGTVPPILTSTSPNGVNGSWNPAVVDEINSASYVFTPYSGQCAANQTILVTVNPSNSLTDFQWTVSEAFAGNQSIKVDAIGNGNFRYQLDAGPFQSNPVFEQVTYGSHSITVKDESGCSNTITKAGILVVNFPKYFTPNGDGYNDNWNVETLKNELSAIIRVFDRFGKLLAEFSPKGSGWNGFYNGNPMPATDYWFVIEYNENSETKKFSSHFTLKR